MNDYYNPIMSGTNLAKYIKLSGLTKGQVAEQKGIAPESLSRHISGRSHFSVQDAIEYGKILGVTPERLLFEPRPIKITGTTNLDTVSMFDFSEKERFVRYHHSMRPSTSCVIMDQKNAAFQLSKLIWFYMSNYIDKEIVSQQCYGEPCVVKTMDGKVLMRRPYPEVNNNTDNHMKFTLQGLQVTKVLEIQQNVTLKWACPIINVMERPDLVGVEIDQ
tara:strand:+ start:969 stop:1622 length:654 start_codon:yes stop_codon:yes gene_type:complete